MKEGKSFPNEIPKKTYETNIRKQFEPNYPSFTIYFQK
jgi:hypothetical protein